MWQSSPKQFELKTKEAHIWSVDKSDHKDKIDQYWELLTDQEKQKAEKFRFYKDRSCYIIARGTLRNLLGAYTSQDPKEITIDYGFHGKPSHKSKSNIQFNISHSEESIVLGFIKDYDIGVDVEKVKDGIEIENIARSFFSEEEVHALLELKKEDHLQAFYNCWTRKEAFIKAEGSGLSFPLNKFVVSLDSTKEARLIETKWDQEERLKWTLTSFELKDDYIGAIAIKGSVAATNFWSLQ